MSKKRNKINLMTITGRELRKLLSHLPVIPGGARPKKHQMIEGNEGDAYFQITREESSNPPGYIFYAIRVSSSSKDKRLTLSSTFNILLGNPSMEFPAKALPNTDSFFWDAKQIDNEQ